MADEAFAALASETRRDILRLLHEQREMTASAVAAQFSQVSRPAIARHLAVLRRAGLVRSARRGRESHYRVDTAPIAVAYHDFLAHFVPMAERSLAELKRIVESNERAGR